MKIAVFSGRFDPPHLGHIMTLTKLAGEHDLVLVPVLSYNNRLVMASEAVQIIQDTFKGTVTGAKVKPFVNLIHFGEIYYCQYHELLRRSGIEPSINDVTYYSGNQEVLEHMKSINVKSEFIPRSRDEYYSSSIIKAGMNV
jgi:nicotinamide mononucleotide adenylyltransferase